MLILIDGFGGSGKTILRSLLDGHKELFVSPSQECLISSFYRNLEKSKFFVYKDISLLRKYLVDSYYYNLEKESLIGFAESDLKRKRNKFNFYEFESFWVNELRKKKKWNNKIILEIIYSSVIKFFYNTKNLPINEKKVFLENGNFDCHKFFLGNFPKSKLIITRKKMPDIIASLARRKVHNKDYDTDGYKNYNFNFLVRYQHFPIRIYNTYKLAERLKKKFPNRVYLCDFEELISNTKNEMMQISKFLDIEFTKILEQPTHFSNLISFKDDDQILVKTKHTAVNTFSKYENKLLLCFEKKNNFNFIISPLVFIDYICCLSIHFFKKISRKVLKII